MHACIQSFVVFCRAVNFSVATVTSSAVAQSSWYADYFVASNELIPMKLRDT